MITKPHVVSSTSFSVGGVSKMVSRILRSALFDSDHCFTQWFSLYDSFRLV